MEVLTGHHKTMRALQHRHQFLPLIAPAAGVVEQNWALLWEGVRAELGINMDLGHALMPAPSESGLPGVELWIHRKLENGLGLCLKFRAVCKKRERFLATL